MSTPTPPATVPAPPPPPGTTPPAPPAGGRRWRLPRLRWWYWLLLAFVAPVIGAGIFFALWAGTFDLEKLGDMPQRTNVYDMDGNAYSSLHASENRLVVKIDQVSKSFLDALVAREDTRFYEHHGVDPHGIARAVVRNLSRHRAAEGASTLTQQLARNSLPLGGKTLTRKVLEAFVALRIERRYTKQQILELYVNRIFYGAGVYGIETASQAYFGKPSSQLDLSESAMLAGLIRSPNRFSPLNNLEAATRERNTVLARMAELGKITRAQADAAVKEPIKVARNRTGTQENYAMEAVQNELSTLLTDEQTDEGGLKIYTTIDPALQKLATEAVETQLAKIESRPGYEHPRKGQNPDADESHGTDYLQGALVLIENRTGAIRALVGGREYKSRADFNRATDAPGRPVGSTFKPFVYTAAWQRGLLPGAHVDDGQIKPGEIPGAPTWSPANSDGTFGGILPAEVGLVRSRNTMSVRVGLLAGLDYVRQVGAGAGLDNIPAEPTILLGTFDTTLRRLTEAYTAFPNAGARRAGYFIERIDDADGQTLYRAPHAENRVLDPGCAWMTHTILREVMQRGTAAEARALGFKGPGAGKTGTTNDFHDAWFVGYTSSLTCGVWVGFDRPQTITAKGYGAALALPVWCQVMAKASPQRYPAKEFQPPEPLKRVRVCAFSNELATDGCETSGNAYTVELPASRVPRRVCPAHGGPALTPDGQPPAPGEPTPSPSPGGQEPFPKRFMRSFHKLFGG